MSLIPVTLLTGFLGAGKTTLLNRLLPRPELAGTAVLINEFGEIGLDHLLVQALDEDAVLLEGGCLCCVVREDLVRALLDLAQRVDAGHAIQRVMIETTGLADPAPILQTLLGHAGLARRFRMDGVVTLVDAVHAASTLDREAVAVRQVAMADRLVLTKTDLARPAGIAPLLGRLAAINPAASVIRAQQGALEPESILGAGLYDAAGKIPDVARWLRAEAYAQRDELLAAEADAHVCGPNCAVHVPNWPRATNAHAGAPTAPKRRSLTAEAVSPAPPALPPRSHDSEIASFSLTFDQPLPWQGLATWLEVLLATRGESVLRIKAVLDLVGEPLPVVLHGVQQMIHPPERLPAWPEGEPRQSRLVFILRGLDRASVEHGLRAFIEASESQAAIARYAS